MDAEAAGRTASVVLLAALLLGLVALAAAQTPPPSVKALALSPPALDLSDPPLVPGGSRVARLTVINAGDEAFDVTTRTAEEAGAWIAVQPAAFNLAAGGKQEVTLTVTVPADTASGPYRGRVDFNPVPTASGDNEILAGISGLLDLVVESTQVHDLVIEGFQVPHIHLGEPLPVQVQARNRGNVPDAYRLGVEVLDAARSGVLVSKSFDSQPVTAGDDRTDTFEVPVVLAEGQYAYTLTATLAETGEVLRREEGLFLLAAPGALFKTGSLDFLSASPAAARTGQEVRITALFRNQGVLEAEAVQFVGTVQRDGKDVGKVESPVVKAGAHGNVTLLARYVPDAAGSYTVKGYVLYDTLRTEQREASFEASPAPGPFLGLTLPGVPAGVTAFLGSILFGAGLMGFLLLFWRRRRSQGRRQAPPPLAAPESGKRFLTVLPFRQPVPAPSRRARRPASPGKAAAPPAAASAAKARLTKAAAPRPPARKPRQGRKQASRRQAAPLPSGPARPAGSRLPLWVASRSRGSAPTGRKALGQKGAKAPAGALQGRSPHINRI